MNGYHKYGLSSFLTSRPCIDGLPVWFCSFLYIYLPWHTSFIVMRCKDTEQSGWWCSERGWQSVLWAPEGGWQCSGIGRRGLVIGSAWVAMLRNNDGQPPAFRPFYLILGGNAPKYEAGFLAKCWVPMLRNTQQPWCAFIKYPKNNHWILESTI